MSKIARTHYNFKKSQKYWTESQKLIAGGGTPTRIPRNNEYPAYFTHAKGCRMWDIDGNEFIDLLCSIGPIILGYAYDSVDDAVREILVTSFQSSMNHPVQLELAKLLIDMVPCAERVRFWKTGSEATQVAVRLARYITGRKCIARSGYHGWADMFLYGDINQGVDEITWESVLSFNGSAEDLDRLMNEKKGEFAAVIFCPADTRPFTTENYQEIIDVAHRHGALAIMDEIKTGFRTSLGGAQQVLNVMPDLTTLSKGLANGYPLSAVVGQAKHMDLINKLSTAGTFAVEALSITAAVATLKVLKEKEVVGHLWKMGQRLIDGLNEICCAHGIEGPLAYADPTPSMPRFTWKPYTNDFSHPAHIYFFNECMRYGLFFVDWHVAFINYSHRERDIDEALDIADAAMANTKKKFNL